MSIDRPENVFVFNTKPDATPNTTVIHVSSSPDLQKLPRNGTLRRGPLCPSSPNLNRPRSARSRNRSSPTPTSRISPYGKVEVFVRCEELPKMDTFSSSDPICVLYVRKYGQWIEYGRTECIPNCHKPKFAETLILEANKQEHQDLRFSIYDTENLTSKDLHKHQLIGSVNIQLIRLLENAQNNGNGEHHERCYDLIYQENAKKRGKIIIDAEELDQSSVNTNVKVCLSAIKLSKKGLNIFGKCDAYFELERKLHNEVFHPVYRSEVVFRNSEPRWKPFQISLQRLCNGNKGSTLRITVYNFQTKGDNVFLGYAETSYESMTKRVGDVKTLSLKKNLSLTNDSKRDRRDSLSKAAIRILQCVPEEQFSLVDYIKGSCKIIFKSAIDFSSSNVDAEESLHSTNLEQMNVYEEALREIGSWLCYYDARTHYELYGFAGVLNGDEEHIQYFCLSQTTNQKSFHIESTTNAGLDELLYLYRSKLPNIKFSGPTVMAPLFNKIMENVQMTTIQDQHFTFVLVLTDGVCNDMDDLATTLEKHKDDPVCFVVTCVGPLRMETQYYFGVLEQKIKKKCGRSIIHPISFALENIQHSLQVIRSSFAKLSREIVEYFESHGIKPLETKSAASPMDTFPNTQDFEDPLASTENDNWQNFIKEATSFCPTCGSHRSIKSPLTDVNM